MQQLANAVDRSQMIMLRANFIAKCSNPAFQVCWRSLHLACKAALHRHIMHAAWLLLSTPCGQPSLHLARRLQGLCHPVAGVPRHHRWCS